MWILKDIFLVVGLVIMAMLLIVNAIGIGFDIQQIRENIAIWQLTWSELSSLVFSVAFVVVVSKLMWKLNKYERAKPILSNRPELFKAIHHLQETARETILKHDVMRNRRKMGGDCQQELADYNSAYVAYWDAEKQFATQMSIAGHPFKKPLVAFQNTIKAYVLSRELPNVLNYSEVIIKLGKAVRDVESYIDAISQ